MKRHHFFYIFFIQTDSNDYFFKKNIQNINMARPIKETPILYGEAARKFEEEMQRVENMTREERMANRKKVEEGCSAFLKAVKVCI